MPQSGESTLKRLFKPVSNPSLQRPRHPALALPLSGPYAAPEVLRPQPFAGFLDPLTAGARELPSSHPSPDEEGVPNNRRQRRSRRARLSACAWARALHFRHADGSRGAQSRPRPRGAPNQSTVPLPTRSPGRWAGDHAHARSGP